MRQVTGPQIASAFRPIADKFPDWPNDFTVDQPTDLSILQRSGQLSYRFPVASASAIYVLTISAGYMANPVSCVGQVRADSKPRPNTAASVMYTPRALTVHRRRTERDYPLSDWMALDNCPMSATLR